jgi:hypothetical protein
MFGKYLFGLVTLVLFTFSGRVSVAQDVRVTAAVDQTTIGMAERVLYSLVVEGSRIPSVEAPQPPATEGLVLITPYASTRTSTSIINGAMQQRVVYEWTYRPQRVGEAQIRAVAIKVGDRSYETSPIDISIVAQVQRQQPGSRAASPGRQTEEAEPAFSEQDLFILAVPSSRDVYQNEQITIDYYLYFRQGMQVRQSSLADSWDADGFWREDLGVEIRPIPEAVTENGVRYNRILLKRSALFPTRPGALEIEPLSIETYAFAPYGNDPFEQFLSRGSRFETVKLTSPAVDINVRPFPAGAPASFNGAVGTFAMTVQVPQTDLNTGEPLTVRATVSGTGNITTLSPPSFAPPGIFDLYDPQVQTSLNREGRQLQGTKAFSYVIVPRDNGRYDLSPVEFTYFDPALEQYVTRSSDIVTVMVTGSPADPVASGIYASGLPVDDIAGIMTDSARWVRLENRPLHTMPATYAALGLPIALLGGLVLLQRRRNRLVNDVEFARNRLAHPVARKHLKRAEDLRRQNKPAEFYAEIEQAVLGFIGNRLNVPERGMTRQRLAACLQDNGVSDQIIGTLHRFLDECDRVRFAQGRPTQEAMQTAAGFAADLIVEIDDLTTKRAGAQAA